MISINTSFKNQLEKVVKKINCIASKERYELIASESLVGEMRHRIHIDGLASNEQPIGTYSSSYLEYRNKNKRGSGTKVILSDTRQMENDLSVIAGTKGWAIGYKNNFNAQKAEWNESHFKKKIFKLTSSEKNKVVDVVVFELKKAIKEC
jgi:hypothetical protein